jgi:hypothetical protein
VASSTRFRRNVLLYKLVLKTYLQDMLPGTVIHAARRILRYPQEEWISKGFAGNCTRIHDDPSPTQLG